MQINSYILKPGHEVVPLKTYEDFINVNNSKKLLEIEKDLDDFYLDGAIEIKYKEQVLLDLDDWDLIDQLWSYILNLIVEYSKNGKSEIYFPDCPAKIRMKKMYDNYLMFSTVTDVPGKEKKILIDEKEILEILLNKANDFFSAISILKDYKDYSLREIKRIKKIRIDIED